MATHRNTRRVTSGALAFAACACILLALAAAAPALLGAGYLGARIALRTTHVRPS